MTEGKPGTLRTLSDIGPDAVKISMALHNALDDVRLLACTLLPDDIGANVFMNSVLGYAARMVLLTTGDQEANWNELCRIALLNAKMAPPPEGLQ